MESVRALLAHGAGSELARTCRGGVVGLRAMLMDAQNRAGGDPAELECQALIVALSKLLDTTMAAEDEAGIVSASSAASTEQAPPSPTPVPPAQVERLVTVAALMSANPAVGAYVDQSGIPGVDEIRAKPATSWRRLHLRLLRPPAPLAVTLGGALAGTDLGVPDQAGRWETWSDQQDAVLVPATRLGEPGIRTQQAAPLHGDVRAFLSRFGGHVPGDVALLAGLASLMFAAAAADDELYLALERLHRTGLTLLDAIHRAAWQHELLSRLTTYVDADDPVAALLALIDVDEAFHSVVHLPLAADGSWWARLGGQVRTLLLDRAEQLRKAGSDVEVLTLTLRYRDLRGRTKGNDLALDVGDQPPGEVLTCFRVWAQVGNHQVPGRVAYRV